MIESHPLSVCLDMVVNIRILEIKKKIKNDNSYSPQIELFNLSQMLLPDPTNKNNKITLSEIIASHGDILLYGGKKGQAAEIFNYVAQALALGAFLPNGIKFGSNEWEVKKI